MCKSLSVSGNERSLAKSEMNSIAILCLSSRTTVTPACIVEEDAYYRTHNMCVFSRIQKRILGLMHKVCVLQRISFGALSDVTVVLG